jgi:uncharacterized membrane protein YkgB
MLKKASLLMVLVVACGCAAAAYAQKRGPSTAEERKRAVEMAEFLEKNPLAKESKENRTALLSFLIEVPDISVKLCSTLLGDTKHIEGDYESELTVQLLFSQAKFIIENPDQAKNDHAVYMAGVEGMLRTWEAVKTASPKAKFPLMEELLQKRQSGSLAEHVKTGISSCR